MKKKSLFYFVLTVFLVVTSACTYMAPTDDRTKTDLPKPINRLSILADFQVKSAFDDTGVIDACRKTTGVDIMIEYKSSTSLRIANIDAKNQPYSAYWATSTIFLPNQPISPVYTAKTYIVIGSFPKVASKLGWDPKNLRVTDVLNGLPSGVIKLLMTNPSQSDPSASFYLATAAALVNETMLTANGISRLPADQLKSYFGNLKGVTDNVDTLKAEIIQDLNDGTSKYNTYVLFESTVIQINQELVKSGLEPVHAYYLADATTGAKFPIVLTAGTPAKEAFTKFTRCITNSDSANKLQKAGYRTSSIGFSMPDADKTVFNPAWGINASMPDLPLKDYPRADDTITALDLYQTAFKPKLRAAFCFDYSGSMKDNGGEKQLIEAAQIIFDQDLARKNGLTVGPNDAYTVFIYETHNYFIGTVYGYDPYSVTQMAETLKYASYTGSTAMFDCVRDAINYLTKSPSYYDQNYPDFDPENYTYAVYVMTDGQTNAGWDYNKFTQFYETLPLSMQIKVYGVGFGDVNTKHGPFVDMTNLTGGIMKDGTKDLVEALKMLFSNY